MIRQGKRIALLCAISAFVLSACGPSASPAPDAASSSAASSAAVSSAQEDTSASSMASSESVDDSTADTSSVTESSSAAESSAVSEEIESTSEPAPEEVADTDEDLGVILAEINENIHEGEAGSSLKIAQVAADVLDFTMRTELDADAIRAQTEAYFSALSEDEKMEYPNKVLLMGETIYTLRENANGAAPEILDSAGITDSGYPWTEDAFEKTVAIQQGCGL